MTAGGNPILDENGQPIQIDSSLTQLKISKTGTLTASDQAGTRSQTFNLGIVNVNNPQALHAEGDNLFSVNGAGLQRLKSLPAQTGRQSAWSRARLKVQMSICQKK